MNDISLVGNISGISVLTPFFTFLDALVRNQLYNYTQPIAISYPSEISLIKSPNKISQNHVASGPNIAPMRSQQRCHKLVDTFNATFQALSHSAIDRTDGKSHFSVTLSNRPFVHRRCHISTRRLRRHLSNRTLTVL
ncbi:hypothetical protein PROFUN_11414 [Planoprotostelium fungivorum]|uniref:Uncharacterized protein n=1 Tax=Planoprotostelium fungivorum TaxID=1890364 RepID=A0A2P6NA95_9EUKA|nr:hypothetical protein PROFUN_11414 [Planoprotostelium fungivorum]